MAKYVAVEKLTSHQTKFRRPDSAVGAGSLSTMTSASAPDAASKSHDDRRERFHKLQRRLRDSSSANRSDVIAEQVKQREASQRKSTAHAFQMAKAERILEDRDLLERGENIERHRAKTYTIEENEAWEKRLEEKDRSRDKGMIGMSSIMKKWTVHLYAHAPKISRTLLSVHICGNSNSLRQTDPRISDRKSKKKGSNRRNAVLLLRHRIPARCCLRHPPTIRMVVH